MEPGIPSSMRIPGGVLDDSMALLAEGYGWLPNRRRRSGSGVVRTRLLGQRAVGLCGPEAARLFYDEQNIRRHNAIPGPVLSTLFGHGAVHTLDGDSHRCRKAMFLSLLDTGSIVEHVTAAWDDAVASWKDGQQVVLFDEASRVLARGVCRWAGVPVNDAEIADLASDLVSMVGGFATVGPRHWRARRARARREKWLGELVEKVRRGDAGVQPGSAVDVIAQHRDNEGRLLDPRVAAVELLNVIRPTVAVCWFVAFAGHALHRWPQHREPLGAAGGVFVTAFVHELRRFYPFAPFVGGRAIKDLTWQGEAIPAGALVLYDLYGQNHDAQLWPDPYSFDPQRFAGRDIDPFTLVPQGAGDSYLGHRCPGEALTVALLRVLTVRLARLDYDVPKQDLTISLRRVPALPKSRFVLVPK